MRGLWLLAFLCWGVVPATAATIGDEALDKSARAKEEYEQGHFDEALQLYRQAQTEAPEARPLNFNVGSALFKTGDLAGAAKEFDVAAAAADAKLKARSYYNLGNTHFQQQQYRQAVEAYKQALEADWQDQDAKANLELALSKQQQQEQQQEQPSDDQKGQDREQTQAGQQGQQQQQQSQEQQNQQQNQNQQQQQSQQQNQQRQENQEQAQGRQGRGGQRNRMDREEAEQLLDALRDREKEAHQRRQHATKAYRGQDW